MASAAAGVGVNASRPSWNTTGFEYAHGALSVCFRARARLSVSSSAMTPVRYRGPPSSSLPATAWNPAYSFRNASTITVGNVRLTATSFTSLGSAFSASTPRMPMPSGAASREKSLGSTALPILAASSRRSPQKETKAMALARAPWGSTCRTG